MKRYGHCLLALSLLGVANAATAASFLPWEEVRITGEAFTHGGVERSVFYFQPLRPVQNPPALFVLHYNDGNASAMANLTEAGRIARDHGVWVIVPVAADGTWSHNPSEANASDDAGFLAALMDHVVATRGVDERRLYMTGYSQGGNMTVRFACDHPDKLAAGASVAATMRRSLANNCAPSRGTPLLFMHGTEDNQIPFEPAPVQQCTATNTCSLSVPEVVQFWADINRCTVTAAPKTLPDRVNDGAVTVSLRHTECAEGAVVELYRVEGGGHAWPGSLDFVPRVGLTTQDYNAIEEIWTFVRQFSR